MSISLPKFLTFLSITYSVSCLRINHSHKAINLTDFCWKDTILRGIGSIGIDCGNNKTRIGLMCYE